MAKFGRRHRAVNSEIAGSNPAGGEQVGFIIIFFYKYLKIYHYYL
jgi:hypothetical protein